MSFGSVNLADNLARWDSTKEPLAHLSKSQKSKLDLLEEEINSLDPISFVKAKRNLVKNGSSEKKTLPVPIDTYQQLLKYYAVIEQNNISYQDNKYISYLYQLQSRRDDYDHLYLQIKNVLEEFSLLTNYYEQVAAKTTSLHEASEQLISDQENLNFFVEKISEYLKYYKEIDSIMNKLEAPNCYTVSINSETFFDLLKTIDNNLSFVQNHSTFKESSSYVAKYAHCQSKAITLLQNYIFKLLSKATNSILTPTSGDGNKNPDAAMALFYGRFQSILPKAKPLIQQIESRSDCRPEYQALLNECHQYFLNQRGIVLGPSVQKALENIKAKYNGDHCSLVRHSCSLLLHASVDEYKLFYQFFSRPSTALLSFSEDLCSSLYDTLRPFIIHINHLETLAEICCILRIEMLDENVQSNSESLQGFGNICLQLLHDVQERLVFRAHLYLQSDVARYNPSPGDLAYPEKLKMMEDIAESIREENRQLRMKKISLSSLDSAASSNIVEPISRTHVMSMAVDPLYHTQMTNSPADLHGMWYPTVRRTLVCLSRLYRCVDRPVFQSLSQEAITYCVQSIELAREKIQDKATFLDAELFLVKHLLILREQIAPFQVDFTVKEYTLDFSNVKTAAFGLLEKRSRLFALSNNALLEFLLEGAPQMKEQLIDSRKQVDSKLKLSCQRLIQHITNLLVEPLLLLLEKSKMQVNLPNRKLGSAEEIAATVSEALRLIKFKLPGVQQSMQLYLANKETEFILFRPIKNNIVAAFTQLSQLLGAQYEGDELVLIACPLPEQISIMLSSSSLAQSKNKNETENLS